MKSIYLIATLMLMRCAHVEYMEVGPHYILACGNTINVVEAVAHNFCGDRLRIRMTGSGRIGANSYSACVLYHCLER